MKIRSPGLIRLVAILVSILLRLWLSTIRYRLSPLARQVDPANAAIQDRYIYAFWHESLLCAAGGKPRAPIHALISQHADGELIAQVSHFMGFGTVRGSSTRGGAKAVRQLLEMNAGTHLLVTPDGPRGPRRKVQDGVIYLASRTGLPIVPVGVGFSNAWRARSWDRFALPAPWSHFYCVVRKVIQVPPGLNREELEPYGTMVEQEMQEATVTAEEWARSETTGRQTHRITTEQTTEQDRAVRLAFRERYRRMAHREFQS